MLKPFPLYPLKVISDSDAPPAHSDQYYTMCIALRELYLQLPDPEVRKKLRYIATLAKCITDHLYQIDPVWFFAIYPRVREYEDLMNQPEKESIDTQ